MRPRSFDLGGSRLCLRQRLLPRASWPPRPRAPFSTTPYASKKKKANSQATTESNGSSKKPGNSPTHDYEPITEAEFERSLWEAQQESLPDPSTQESASDQSENMSTAAWSTLKNQLREAKDHPSNETLSKITERLPKAPKAPEPSKSNTPKSAKKKKKDKVPLDVKTINPSELSFDPVDQGKQELPTLSYNLDRVLFNPGVYQIQDPRTHVYNFDPYLTSIMPVEEFDFDALKEYITSSKDSTLQRISKEHGKKYCGSTSSMTSVLSHFHYLLSAWRKPNISSISRSLEPDSTNFTRLLRSPAAAYARLNDYGVYSFDADKEYDKENVLSMLGKSMEKLLTLPKEDYERYRHTRSHLITEEERNADEAYHYTTLGDFMMRSQLDAYDSRLPGTGVFDLKTRAVISIRMDVHDYRQFRGYEIKNRFGEYESFEREYFDLIRAAFLKYSLQVRMGRMDGIFLAYHNTQRIFGFQYVGLEEMDHALHGTTDRRLGDQEFKASVKLLNELLDRATQRFPGRSLRLHVETRETKVPLTYFFVEPVTEDDMKTDEEEAKRSVDNIQKDIMNRRAMDKESHPSTPQYNEVDSDFEENSATNEQTAPVTEDAIEEEENGADAWEEMMAKVEETIENESLGIESVKGAVHEALAQRDLLRHGTEEENQQSIDALVEALTSESPSLRDIRDTIEDEGVSPQADSASARAQGQSYGTTADTPAQSDPALEAEQQALKDLIVKVTRGVNDRQRELREFELAVAQLVAKAKPQDTQPKAQEESPSEQDMASGEPEGDDTSAPPKEPLLGSMDMEEPDPESTKEQRWNGFNEYEPEELMGVYITIRNVVNGKSVIRPGELGDRFDWEVQYTINDIPEDEARTIHRSVRKRRFEALHQNNTDRRNDRGRMYRNMMKKFAKDGEEYRETLDKQQSGKDVFVAWDTNPLPPETRTRGLAGTSTPVAKE